MIPTELPQNPDPWTVLDQLIESEQFQAADQLLQALEPTEPAAAALRPIVAATQQIAAGAPSRAAQILIRAFEQDPLLTCDRSRFALAAALRLLSGLGYTNIAGAYAERFSAFLDARNN